MTVQSSFDQHWFPNEKSDLGSSPKSAAGGNVATVIQDPKVKRKHNVQIVDTRRRGVGPGVT